MTAAVAPELIAQIGEASRRIGWEACWSAVQAAGEAVADEARRQGIWRHPRYAELEARRTPDHRPCGLKSCGGRCSRCVHAAAWRSRGGRPYLGKAQEAARGAA